MLLKGRHITPKWAWLWSRDRDCFKILPFAMMQRVTWVRQRQLSYLFKMAVSRQHLGFVISFGSPWKSTWMSLSNFAWGYSMGIVISFKFHQNQLSGFRDVGGRNLPFPLLYIQLYSPQINTAAKKTRNVGN